MEGRSDAGAGPRDGVRLRVRLRGDLLHTAVVCFVAALVPMTIALVAVATASGRWPVLLGVELVCAAVCLAIVLRRRHVFAEVTDTELRGNGIASPLESVALADIGAVHLVPTYVLGSESVVTQLLVLDRTGRRLFRMRGTYWERGDLELIAAALPVRAHVVREPIALADFWREYPTSEYWFENKPVVRVASILAVCALSAILAITVMGPVGIG